jgi:hypothetical protein
MRLLLLILLTIAGCTAPPTITMEYSNGQMVRTEVTGVPGATEPATISHGNITISTGHGQGFDQALDALSTGTTWVSILLILAGLGVLILSNWIPMLPRSTSVILIASGGGLLAFPILLDRYSFIVFTVLGGLALLFLYGMWDNRKKLKTNVR